MSPSNTFWWIYASLSHAENNPIHSNEEIIWGAGWHSEDSRCDLPPKPMIRTKWLNLENWSTRKSHGAAPCWSNPNDPNELWSKGLEAKGMQARRSGNALLKHPQFPGIACGDAYVSLRTPGCCLSGLIAFPLQWTTGFWTWLTWTKLNKSITDDPRWHDPKCTKVSWLLHSAAPSDAFLCPCPFLCPFPYRLCLQTRRMGKMAVLQRYQNV